MNLTFTIEARLRAPGQQWAPCIYLSPKSREEADTLAAKLHQAMPMKDFRVKEIAPLRDEDIPF